MKKKKTRLQQALSNYYTLLHTYLDNPLYEDEPNEVVDPLCDKAYDEFIKEFLLNEDECAEFLEHGRRYVEIDWLEIAYNHFKSEKIYNAIKENCDIAFSQKFVIESDELTERRKDLLLRMEKELFEK
ncbi:MAG: hypothetical protein IKL82_05810 [Clostridia bacterium]|nr:hypothetical protein [Clostridia bacterium]